MSYQTFATIVGKLWLGVAFLYVDVLGVSRGIAALWDHINIKGKFFASSQNFLAITFQQGENCW